MKFTISKIRLINFHNFVNETIVIPNGGHLFMLGDNGSGKTTVLDAVHYVLTAGRSMEFNAAARVIGKEKSGGRSVQGVVMRYNIETGARNPNGGTTYAALELAGRGGRPTTIAIGMTTRSMEEAIERWGVIRECALDELPLLVAEPSGVRPRTKQELREALGNSGFYAQIGSYEKELARRFFGDEETYEDVCKFLKTGKAYREIVASTADYHLLFRELLQEPEREVFEHVVAHLKSLEASRADLDGMRRKLVFLNELTTRQGDVRAQRVTEASCRWLAWDLALKGYWTAHDRAATRIEAEHRRLTGLEDDRKHLELQLEGTQQRLTELLNKDAANLLGQEQEARRACEHTKLGLTKAQARLKELMTGLEQVNDDLATARGDLRKHLQAFGRQLQRLHAELPFQTSSLRTALEEAAESETPEAVIGAIPAGPLRNEADLAVRALDRQIQAADSRIHTLGRQRDKLMATIAELKARGETVPDVPEFVAAQRAIGRQALKVRPLYLGLEPVAGATARELAALEQTIGDAVLATWLVDADDAATLRGLIFRDFPAQTLAVMPDSLQEDVRLSDWVRRYFDVSKSDPAALIILQQQLEAKEGPAVAKFLDHAVLTFRRREQRLREQPARLLGAEVRRRELERELRNLEKEQKETERELRESEKELRVRQEEAGRIDSFRSLLDAAMAESHARKDAIQGLQQRCYAARSNCENAREECVWKEEDFQRQSARHEDLRIRLQSEGLAGLEQRILEVRRKLKKLTEERDTLTRETGRVALDIENQRGICAANQEHIRTTDLLRNEAEARLRQLAAVGDAIAAFAAQQSAGIAPTPEALQAAANGAQTAAAVGAEKIRSLAAGADGVAFAFVYEEPVNTLTDRRGRSLADVLTGAAQELQEQESLINEKTVNLFRQIVMHGLVEALQFRVRRLNDMIRRIARLLKDRSFGNNRYAFTAVPHESYRKIHDLVLNYSALDPQQAEADLRHFIEDHAAEIMGTEIGEIPPLLDYRNWFRYELKVMTDKEDGIVMDRRVKSVGSGGEQAVPNYLLILTIAHFLYNDDKIRLPVLLFDEAFYGIDASRRDQLLSFTSDLGLQLFVASPDQDGVKREIPYSTSVLVVKDANYDVHLHDFHWTSRPAEQDFLKPETTVAQPMAFGEELAAAPPTSLSPQ